MNIAARPDLIPEIIRKARTDKDLTLADFSAALFGSCAVQPTKQAISNWEQGHFVPSLELLLDVVINSPEDSWQSILAGDCLAALYPHLQFHPRSPYAQKVLGRDAFGISIEMPAEGVSS